MGLREGSLGEGIQLLAYLKISEREDEKGGTLCEGKGYARVLREGGVVMGFCAPPLVRKMVTLPSIFPPFTHFYY